MITFKGFLFEAAVKAKPKFAHLDVESAVQMLNTHCKDAIWMLQLNRPIYRGDPGILSKRAFQTVDTSATERKSENTSNYYTMIIDNNPACKNFPKRSRSFIGSTNKMRAGAYSFYNQAPVVMIPFDRVPIGIVNKVDMWDTKIKLFGIRYDIEELNDEFEYLGIKARFENLKSYAEKLKNSEPDDDIYLNFMKVFGEHADHTKFLEEIMNAYSPKNTGHTVATTATMPRDLNNTEVWVGGKVVMINSEMWQDLVKTYKALNK